jgi:putative protease
MDQVQAALEASVATIYVDFEDIRRYREAVQLVRQAGSTAILLATPRIHKAGETGVFRLLEKAEADGILVRNLGALDYFRQLQPKPRLVGDFSLNVANPLTASHFMQEGLDRLTISYDLNAGQVLDLLRNTPAQWLEITLHQNIPMFHMEHCVFAAFLSGGTDHTNCGRPCDRHQLELRDRVGLLHPVKADVGCRNTVFHGQSQSGASVHEAFAAERPAGFRVELLGESKERAGEVIAAYRRLLAGEIDSATLLRLVRARNQLGVTVAE